MSAWILDAAVQHPLAAVIGALAAIITSIASVIEARALMAEVALQREQLTALRIAVAVLEAKS